MHHQQILASTALFFAATCGHVILEVPKPFKFADDGASNPVTAATFPCKMPEGKKLEIDGSPHQMVVGEDQPLSFSGHAVHSGGSCQISLTSDISDDFQPRRDSRFFVIHSIEGGCPARNTSGNLDGPNVDKYSFKIPTGVNPGKHVLSWTWLPKGGSPEFYMNCSPIVVSTAKKTMKRMRPAERRKTALVKREDFPDMYMANLKELTGDCTTNKAQNEGMAVAYPNPGKSVDRPNGSEKLYMQQCDGNPRASGGNKNSSLGSGSASAPAPSSTTRTADIKSSSTTAVPFSAAITASKPETKRTSAPTKSVTPTSSAPSISSTMTSINVTSTSTLSISRFTVFHNTTLVIGTPVHSATSSEYRQPCCCPLA